MIEKDSVNVSIIVPNYNNGKCLVEFIQSVLNSTLLPCELIIIDDGSTDESIDILDRFKELRFLKVIRFNQNQGLPAALNAGLDMASGKYIMRADPDDLLHPDRIESQFQFMENHPEIDVVGCNVTYFHEKIRKEINISNFPSSNEKIIAAYRRGEHGMQHPTIFARKEAYQKYSYQDIFPGEDYELFSRMASNGHTFHNLSEPLYFMRVHPESSTSNIKIGIIRQTFEFRDRIFGTKTNPLWIYIYYQHIRHYRKSQMADKMIVKYMHLFISSLLYPAKSWRRLKKHDRTI